MAAPSIADGIFPAPCISTSITWPTSRTRFPTCCPARRTSPRRSGCSASATAIASWFMTGCVAAAAARGHGGCSAYSATTRSLCSTVALANGSKKSCRPRCRRSARSRNPSPPTFNPALVRTLSEMKANLVDRCGASHRRPRSRQVRWHPGRRISLQEARPHTERHQIPWADLIDPDSGAFIAADALAARFAAAGIELATSDRDHMRLRHHLLRRGARALFARP